MEAVTMLYRPYIQKLYAAINLPIHRYVYQHSLTSNSETYSPLPTDSSTSLNTSAPTTPPTLVLSESYEPRGISSQYQQQALAFAQKLHLDLGDKIYMRSSQDLAAVLLPDQSLVIIGPIHINKNSIAKKPCRHHKVTATPSDVANNEHGSRQMLHAMQSRMVNLWLDMVCQIIMHDVIPPISELQAYAEADRLIPPNLKSITKEIKLKAPHNQYRYELAILDAVAEGDLDKVNRAFLVPKQGKFGILGPTELRSMQNHVHNLNSLVSRTAIHSGILPEKAYALSDRFFMAAEACTTVEQCIELRTIYARSFATLIREYRQQHLQALPNLVHNTQLIVSRSLYENCTVASLAQKLQVNPDHLML